MGVPNTDSIKNGISGVSSGGSVADPTVQRFATGIYVSAADKTFATYELSELNDLPKSLFYDAATSDGVYSGLFAYYVLGKNTQGKKVRYDLSETTEYLQEITPRVSRNPTAKMIIDTVSGTSTSGSVPAFMDPNSPYRGQVYNVKDFIFCN